MIRVRTLGQSTIEIGSKRIGPESAVLFGLLLILASQRGRPVSKSYIRELLWPGVSERKAWHSLRQLLYRIRRLGVEIESRADHLTLHEADVDVDFLSLATSNGASVDGCRGVFLDAYRPHFSPPLLAWIDEQRSIVHARLRNVLLADLSLYRTRGSWRTVEQVAREVLTLDPLNEEATLSLAEASALAGSKANAVALLDRYIAELGDDSRSRLAIQPKVLRRRIAERLRDDLGGRSGETTFVGRGDSMAFLNRALERARLGTGNCCYLWGPAGIGKTRLLTEFGRSAGLSGATVECASCQACSSQQPLGVFAALVPRLLALPGALGCAPESLDLLQRLVSHDSNAVALSHAAAEAAYLAGSIRRSIYDLLDAVAAENLVVIVVEDVHWADSQSRGLIGELTPWITTRRIVLICSSREPPEVSETGFGVQALGPLNDGETLTLIQSVDVARQWDAATSDRCIRIAQGNPLYAKTLLEFWQLTGDTASVPPTLAALFASRLADLPEDSLLALQGIAVLGRNATATRLCGVLQFRNYQLIRALDMLATQGLIVVSGERLACAHELISFAAVDRLTLIARRSLHRLTAQQLEADRLNTLDADVLWDCANHWGQTGDPERAITFALDCSKHLLELGMPHEAAQLLESTRSIATTNDTFQLVLGALATALQHAGRWQEVHAVLEERRTRSARESCVHDDYELLSMEAAWLGHHRHHVRLLSQARHCASAPEASASHRIHAASQGIKIAAECCDRERASNLYAAVRNVPDAAMTARRLELETVFNTCFGNLDEGVQAADRLVASHRMNSTRAELARALRFASFPFRLVGRLDDAETALLESLDLAIKHRLHSAETQAVYRLGVHYLAVGQPSTTLDWCSHLSARHSGYSDEFGRSYTTLLAVQAFLALSDVISARAAYATIADFEVLKGLTRAVNEFVAVRVRMQLEDGGARIDSRELAKLVALHLRTRGMGGEDFAAGTLFRALALTGDNSRARQLFAEYVTHHRRDRIAYENELAEYVHRFETLDGTSPTER